MPVQINEMTVTVVVQDTAPITNAPTTQQTGGADTSKLIKMCVDEVMEALQRKNER